MLAVPALGQRLHIARAVGEVSDRGPVVAIPPLGQRLKDAGLLLVEPDGDAFSRGWARDALEPVAHRTHGVRCPLDRPLAAIPPLGQPQLSGLRVVVPDRDARRRRLAGNSGHEGLQGASGVRRTLDRPVVAVPPLGQRHQAQVTFAVKRADRGAGGYRRARQRHQGASEGR